MRPVENLQLMRKEGKPVQAQRLDRRLKSIQVESLKLIRSDRGETELYDLTADPAEEHDLSSERVADVARLGAILDEWSQARPEAQGTSHPELDPEAVERLRALGYAK